MSHLTRDTVNPTAIPSVILSALLVHPEGTAMKKLPLWTLAIFAAVALAIPAWAQQDLTGNWQGTLQAGRDLRTVVKISKAGDELTAVLYSSIRAVRRCRRAA
jgi:hypothetical protein